MTTTTTTVSAPAPDPKALANKLSADENADVILLNCPLLAPSDVEFRQLIRDRKRKKRDRVYVILVTEGGTGDVAFRMSRCMQLFYRDLVVVVPGWCKSAGTLFCVGANKLIFGDRGELGPIDVQLRRADEIGERDSGLAVDAAFDGLAEASFKLFEKYMMGIKEKSNGSVTFKTAASIAAQVSIGLVSPIFAQLDPVRVGEVHRSVRVAEEYATRLDLFGKNIRKVDGFDAISMLVRGYPEHGFVIDYIEAHIYFKNLSRHKGTLRELVRSLGDDAMIPMVGEDSSIGGSNKRMEYLNDEPQPQNGSSAAGSPTEPQPPPSDPGASGERPATGNGDPTGPGGGLSGDPQEVPG